MKREVLKKFNFPEIVRYKTDTSLYFLKIVEDIGISAFNYKGYVALKETVDPLFSSFSVGEGTLHISGEDTNFIEEATFEEQEFYEKCALSFDGEINSLDEEDDSFTVGKCFINYSAGILFKTKQGAEVELARVDNLGKILISETVLPFLSKLDGNIPVFIEFFYRDHFFPKYSFKCIHDVRLLYTQQNPQKSNKDEAIAKIYYEDKLYTGD